MKIFSLLAYSAALSGGAFAAPTPIHLEAEDAKLTGPTIRTTRAGFTGEGYVGDFSKDGDKIVWDIPRISEGVYELRLHYCSPHDAKSYDLLINENKISGNFPKTGSGFETIVAAKVKLENGEYSIAIEKGWGYYEIDALDLVPIGATAARPQTEEATTTPRDNALRLEAENAELEGPTIRADRAGFSGKGYVGDFSKDGDRITWKLPNAAKGIYEIKVGYCSPFDSKSYDLMINGIKSEKKFPMAANFTTISAGKIELEAGENTIAIEKGWGYYEIDFVDLIPMER